MDHKLIFFADENISPELVEWIAENGYEIDSIYKSQQFGISDEQIINDCFAKKQIIITHDNDFGKLVFTTNINFYIIIYLRPGHFLGSYHIPTILKILNHKEHFLEKTLIIAFREKDIIKMRIKHL
jgi:predicted nuclease of predicted toxin-antitoxin system